MRRYARGPRTRVLAGLCPVVLFLGALGSAPGETMTASGAQAGVHEPGPSHQVTVMTRNLYLGASLNEALGATTFARLVRAATSVFGQVQRNDIAERAETVAREIAEHEPHLVGLQEVALWRSGGFDPDAPARTVELDYLQILLAALSARGLDYAPVPDGVVTNADVEVPRCATTPCRPRHLQSLQDIRLTDRDVVLARTDLSPRDLTATTFETANYAAVLTLAGLGGARHPVQVTRGYVAVDATLRGRTVRVVNTHLEAADPGINRQQAQELLLSEAVTSRQRVVLLGDFNNITATGHSTGALEQLVAAGFVDVWARARPDEPGPTCCESADLGVDPPGADADLDRRIDLVLVRSRMLQTKAVERTGAEPGDRTASGLWPSDHAGVVAELLIR